MKYYPHYLQVTDFFNLNLVASQFKGMFGNYGIFLVGSSLLRSNYRDVDLRMIIDDSKFVELFGVASTDNASLQWRVLCTSISEYFRNRTSLPVDFQIQGITHANEAYPVDGGNLRIALGHMAYDNKKPVF